MSTLQEGPESTVHPNQLLRAEKASIPQNWFFSKRGDEIIIIWFKMLFSCEKPQEYEHSEFRNWAVGGERL